jgi:hypothetical protein
MKGPNELKIGKRYTTIDEVDEQGGALYVVWAAGRGFRRY